MSEFMQKIDRLTSKFASQDTCELCAVEELAEQGVTPLEVSTLM